MTNHWWTEERRNLLIQCMDEGMGADDCADVLGRTPIAVTCCAAKLGRYFGKPPFWTPAKEAELRAALAERMTAGEVAQALGATSSMVRSRATKLGLAFNVDPARVLAMQLARPLGPDPEDRNEARRLASLDRDWRIAGECLPTLGAKPEVEGRGL